MPPKPAIIFVHREIRKHAKKFGVSISDNAIIIVDGHIKRLVKEAARRAKGNKRKTILPCDC